MWRSLSWRSRSSTMRRKRPSTILTAGRRVIQARARRLVVTGNADRMKQVPAAIGRALREDFDFTQPLPDRLADLVRKIAKSERSEAAQGPGQTNPPRRQEYDGHDTDRPPGRWTSTCGRACSHAPRSSNKQSNIRSGRIVLQKDFVHLAVRTAFSRPAEPPHDRATHHPVLVLL
jgi:hypothetical protein